MTNLLHEYTNVKKLSLKAKKDFIKNHTYISSKTNFIKLDTIEAVYCVVCKSPFLRRVRIRTIRYSAVRPKACKTCSKICSRKLCNKNVNSWKKKKRTINND